MPSTARHTPGSPSATIPATYNAAANHVSASANTNGRQRLRDQQLDRGDGRGQQRFERLRLLLADHGVRRERGGRHDRYQQQQQGELVEQEGLDQARCRSGRPAPASSRSPAPTRRRSRRTPRAYAPRSSARRWPPGRPGTASQTPSRAAGRMAPGLRISSRASFSDSAEMRRQLLHGSAPTSDRYTSSSDRRSGTTRTIRLPDCTRSRTTSGTSGQVTNLDRLLRAVLEFDRHVDTGAATAQRGRGVEGEQLAS